MVFTSVKIIVNTFSVSKIPLKKNIKVKEGYRKVCDKDKEEHNVAKLDVPTRVRVDDGCKGDKKNRARHEGGTGKENKLQLANVEKTKDGYWNKNCKRVTVGTEALKERVQLAAGSPLTKRPENQRGKEDVAEGHQH